MRLVARTNPRRIGGRVGPVKPYRKRWNLTALADPLGAGVQAARARKGGSEHPRRQRSAKAVGAMSSLDALWRDVKQVKRLRQRA